MYGKIVVLLSLAIIPFLVTEAYATHLTAEGLNDVWLWREFDVHNDQSVYCTFLGDLEAPFETDQINLMCKAGMFDGLNREGAMFLMKVFDVDKIYNGTTVEFEVTADQNCSESACMKWGVGIMDGAYTYNSLTEPGGFPPNINYGGKGGAGCASSIINDWSVVPTTGSLCLSIEDETPDNDNIFGGGNLDVLGIDSTLVSQDMTGIKALAIKTRTIVNAEWTEQTQNQITLFIVIVPEIDDLTNAHWQPERVKITNTPSGDLIWNFPKTDFEVDNWADFGGAGMIELNGTESDYGFFFSYDPSIPDPPTNLFAILQLTQHIDLFWTAPVFVGFNPLIGYKIERESPIGGGFSTLVTNTGNTVTTYTDTTVQPGTEYNYRVRALNSAGESLPSNESKDGVPEFGPADPPIKVSCDGLPTVFSLEVPVIGLTDAILCWNGAILNQTTLLGYQVNSTTPWGDPQTIAVNNTNNNATQITLTPLSPNTNYSVRVQSWYDLTASNVTNIVNFTTRGIGLEIPDLEIPTEANPLRFDWIFSRTNQGDDVEVLVEYPNSFNATCVLEMKFARNNVTFTDVATVPASVADRQVANFTFLDYNDELVVIDCIDVNSNSTGAYIVYQTMFPLLAQVDSFRDGTYGTMGQFGFFDFFTVAAMFFAMIGFNRVHPGVGVIFAMMILGVAEFLGFVENIFTTATIGIIMTVVILAVLVHHRNDVSN